MVLLAAAGMGIVAAWGEIYYDRLDQLCPWYDDEGTMAAPVSPQGRFVCDESSVGQGFLWILVGGVIALLLVTFALWLCRHLRLAVAALLVAALLPVGLAEVGLRLDGSCSKAQWATYGKDGCERDREMR